MVANTLGSISFFCCLSLDINTTNSQELCPAEWTSKVVSFLFDWFHKCRAHLSKGLSKFAFLQPAILLLFHFNLTSSFCTCSYPLWSPLHFCYSCPTFAPQQHHFTLLLQDDPAHHIDVIQHLYLKQTERKTTRVHLDWNSEDFDSNARNAEDWLRKNTIY